MIEEVIRRRGRGCRSRAHPLRGASTDQQALCINRFGPDVNLGNVALDDIVNLEALRLGLRADTAVIASGPRPPNRN